MYFDHWSTDGLQDIPKSSLWGGDGGEGGDRTYM